MSGDLGGLLSTALAIVSIATLAGLGLTRGTITNLREQLADARADTSSLRADRTDDRATIEAQAAELDTLKKVVTGEVHWLAITDLLDLHHKEAREFWQRAEVASTALLDLVRRIDGRMT